eukprot:scaffold22702_cov149-Cylindrotheca_fusiformis.AAC.8
MAISDWSFFPPIFIEEAPGGPPHLDHFVGGRSHDDLDISRSSVVSYVPPGTKCTRIGIRIEP